MKKIIKDKNGNVVGYTSSNSNNGIEDYKDYIRSEINSNITDLKNDLLPVGSILINNNSDFTIEGQTWNLIGRLAEGQSIIGSAKSSTNNGSIISHGHGNISHKHKIGTGRFEETENGSHGSGSYGIFFSWEGYNTNGDPMSVGRVKGNKADDGRFHAQTNNIPYTKTETLVIPTTGGTYNKAYGLGIGSKYIWERIG